MRTLTFVIAQIDPLVGDVAGNTMKVIHAAHEARDRFKADLVIFPELTLTGYPPEDLLLRPGLLKRVNKALDILKKHLRGVAILVGHPDGEVKKELYNAASLIRDGECVATYYKQ